MKLSNKICLVTGAGSGIGRAIARGFKDEGAIVLVNDIDAAKANATVEWLGSDATALTYDISKVDQIYKMFTEIDQKYGRLDVLVNNAGLTGWSNIWETTEALFDRVISLNLKGTLFCSIEAAKLMKANHKGSIINISTICAELGVKNLPVYSASKGGIQALSKQLAVEFAPYGIRVNTFGPGAISGDRNLKDDPNYDQNWANMIPLGRTGAEQEMVGPAVFLASDDASYITGQQFFVDGGWTAQGKISETSMDAQLKSN